MDKYYYFDNSTTSFPKPKEVAEDMSNFLLNIGGTYGRVNTKRGKYTTEKIEECRELLANKFIGTKKDSNIVFTSGATRAVNDILIGLDLHDTKILISSLDIEALSEIVKKEKISLAIVNMESNISGVIQPIKEIKETLKDIPLLVDATQYIGVGDIFADDWNIDYLAFTGHKGLLGPTGTGGFYVKEPNKLKASYFGGGFGDGFETPYSVPEIYEAGTPNTVGIIGLLAALKNRPSWNITTDDMISTIKKIESSNKYKVIWSKDKSSQGFLFSIESDSHMSEIAHRLYDDFNIECRYGFHCAILAHNFYNNNNGAIRFSFSPYTTKEDLEYLADVLTNKL